VLILFEFSSRLTALGTCTGSGKEWLFVIIPLRHIRSRQVLFNHGGSPNSSDPAAGMASVRFQTWKRRSLGAPRSVAIGETGRSHSATRIG
jgi:hypothetical protein